MIYDNVKRLCRENGTSIFQVEKACGIGNGVIGKWKQETQNPSVETLKKHATLRSSPPPLSATKTLRSDEVQSELMMMLIW